MFNFDFKRFITRLSLFFLLITSVGFALDQGDKYITGMYGLRIEKENPPETHFSLGFSPADFWGAGIFFQARSLQEIEGGVEARFSNEPWETFVGLGAKKKGILFNFGVDYLWGVTPKFAAKATIKVEPGSARQSAIMTMGIGGRYLF